MEYKVGDILDTHNQWDAHNGIYKIVEVDGDLKYKVARVVGGDCQVYGWVDRDSVEKYCILVGSLVSEKDIMIEWEDD